MTEFLIAGRAVHLDAEMVIRRMRTVEPEPVTVHGVEIEGRRFPVVQVLEVASGVPGGATRSARARQVLRQLGFELVELRDDSGGFRQGGLVSPSVVPPGASEPPHLKAQGVGASALEGLTAPRTPLRDVVARPTAMGLDGFGLYAIYGDRRAWAELGLGPFDGRPLYVGKAESGTLLTRDIRTHFASGRTGSSTLRRSIAALLRDRLALRGIPRNPQRPERFANYGLSASDDERLTAWMITHLELATWLSPPAVSLIETERAVLRTWVPALNVADSDSPWRELIQQRRATMANDARRWANDSSW